jgi:hypothetical protein
MDTLRDKNYLQGIWDKGNAPWLPHKAMESLAGRDLSVLQERAFVSPSLDKPSAPKSVL